MRLSENLIRVFSKEGNDFEGFKKLFFDYTHGETEFELEDGSIATRKQAKAKIDAVIFDIFGFEAGTKPSKRDIKRAMAKHGLEFYEVIEDTLDLNVSTGLEENEFFNEFVETKNIALGDRNEFWTDDEVYLTVAKVADGHHDFNWRIGIA